MFSSSHPLDLIMLIMLVRITKHKATYCGVFQFSFWFSPLMGPNIFLRKLQSLFFLQSGEPSLTPVQNNQLNVCFSYFQYLLFYIAAGTREFKSKVCQHFSEIDQLFFSWIIAICHLPFSNKLWELQKKTTEIINRNKYYHNTFTFMVLMAGINWIVIRNAL